VLKRAPLAPHLCNQRKGNEIACGLRSYPHPKQGQLCQIPLFGLHCGPEKEVKQMFRDPNEDGRERITAARMRSRL
jgi:hypothetical protein